MKLLLALALLMAACSSGIEQIDGYTFDRSSPCTANCTAATNAVRSWAETRGGATRIELYDPEFSDGNLHKTSGLYYVAVVMRTDGSTTATGVSCTMGCTAGVSMLSATPPRTVDGFVFDPSSTCTDRCEIAMQYVTLPFERPLMTQGATVHFYKPVYENGTRDNTPLQYVAVIAYPDGREHACGILMGPGPGWYPPHGCVGWNGR